MTVQVGDWMKYRKKPLVVEAMQWTGFNYTESEKFCGEELAKGIYRGNPGPYSVSTKVILTLEGAVNCSPGDWIIKGLKGEFYPCKPDIFEATYEKEQP
jgi:hypothetical protein